MVWLGEPPTPATFVTDEMLRQLAAQGVVAYESDGTVKFTQDGAQHYRDTVGHWPTRNI
jgi:Mn-dependent DtxR family transcriptional regulator